MSRTITRSLIASALVAVTIGAGVAEAGVPTISSKAKLSLPQPFVFKTRVTSDKQGCERFRKVTVFHRKNGPDQAVGTDKTDTGGVAKVEVNQLSENEPYYAKVDRRETDHFICSKTKSPDFKP